MPETTSPAPVGSEATSRGPVPLRGRPRPDKAHRQGRDVHVKQVPEEIWLRARQNALASGLAFKDYVMRLLADSRPFERPGKSSPLVAQLGQHREA